MGIIEKTKVVVWNIGFIESNISELLSSNDYKIVWMKHKYNDRFFADPFILSADEKTICILAEEYLFVEGKGKIVKLTIDRNSKVLLKREKLLETPFHLSYPFLYGNHIYPEQNSSGKWIRYNLEGDNPKVVSDVGFIDGTIFNDGFHEWLFATKIDEGKADACRKLYRYEIINGQPSAETELLIKNDYIASRPAGNFFNFRGEWYRVAQSSSDKIYGEYVSICKILSCTESSYSEEKIMEVSSKNERRFNRGLHTLNLYDDFIVVDGFEMQMHAFQKIKSKIKGLKND